MALQPGQRIRIDYDTAVTKHFLYIFPYSLTEDRTITGELLSWDSNYMVISTNQPDSQNIKIVTSTVKKIYINDGQRRLWLDGLATGGLIGFFILYAGVPGDPENPEEERWVDQNPARAATLIIGGSALSGGIIGWFIKSERWREVDRKSWSIDPRLTLSNQGIGFKLSYHF